MDAKNRAVNQRSDGALGVPQLLLDVELEVVLEAEVESDFFEDDVSDELELDDESDFDAESDDDDDSEVDELDVSVLFVAVVDDFLPERLSFL